MFLLPEPEGEAEERVDAVDVIDEPSANAPESIPEVLSVDSAPALALGKGEEELAASDRALQLNVVAKIIKPNMIGKNFLNIPHNFIFNPLPFYHNKT